MPRAASRSGVPPRSRADWLVPLVCLLVTGGLFGVATTLAKLAPAAGLASLPLVAWSVTGAAVVLLTVNAARGIAPRMNRAKFGYALASGFITIAAPFTLMFAAIPRVGAGFMALAITFPPLFTYLGALALRMERFDAVRALGVLLALAGAAWIALLKLATPDAPVVWVVAALAVPLILATGNLYRTLRWPAGARPEELAPPMMTAAAVMLILWGVAMPGASLAVPLDRPAPLLLVAAQTVVFSIQYLLYFVLQKRGGPVYLSLLGAVGAVTGVPLAVLVLGEPVPHGLAAGALLIAAGIALMTMAIGRLRARGAS